MYQRPEGNGKSWATDSGWWWRRWSGDWQRTGWQLWEGGKIGRAFISLEFDLIFTLHDDKIELCMIDSCKAFGYSILELVKLDFQVVITLWYAEIPPSVIALLRNIIIWDWEMKPMQYFPLYRTLPLTHWNTANVIFPLYWSLILFLFTLISFAQENKSRFISGLIDLNLYYTHSFSCHFIPLDNGSTVLFFFVEQNAWHSKYSLIEWNENGV